VPPGNPPENCALCGVVGVLENVNGVVGEIEPLVNPGVGGIDPYSEAVLRVREESLGGRVSSSAQLTGFPTRGGNPSSESEALRVGASELTTARSLTLSSRCLESAASDCARGSAVTGDGLLFSSTEGRVGVCSSGDLP
jgi:hypothetical protein